VTPPLAQSTAFIEMATVTGHSWRQTYRAARAT
jgi:hypothetical protein